MKEFSISKYSKYIWGIVFSVIPVIAFYLMEFYEHNPFAEVRSMAQLFNIIIFELIAWLLYVFTGRSRWAARMLLVFAMLFGLVNHYVMLFRTTPFVPWDIFSVNTAASVASNYDFTPSSRVIIVTILFILLICVVHFVDYKMESRFVIRLIPTVIITICLCVFTNMLQDDDFQTDNYLYPYLFTPAYMTQVNGMAVTFAMDLEYVVVDKPTAYSPKEARNELENYSEEGQKEAVEELPNIIVIMDEAFSDLSVIGELDTNKDYMPFIHRLQKGYENTVSGNLNVSVCGGNTANTEFEFLTGNTMAFLPTGSIPYQQYIKDDTFSLATHLGNLGYQTYAQHPYYASGWNRDKVYSWFGFHELTFINDYQSKRILRKYVSDESDFEQIKETFSQKQEGSPAFIFNVTMQNHGGYSEQYLDFANTVTATNQDSDSLNQYLTLLSMTDKALEDLINYFSTVDEKTIIVFFGDHQPNNAISSLVAHTEENDYNRYQVPYIMWANYDIEENTDADTSVNYLAARVLQTAGVPTDSYQNFLLDLEQEYPIISAVRTEQTSQADEEMLNKYKRLQYYMLFDWKE